MDLLTEAFGSFIAKDTGCQQPLAECCGVVVPLGDH